MENFLIAIVNLFYDEAFRHWFFWTAVILAILGVHPFRIFHFVRTHNNTYITEKDKKKK